MGAWLVTWEGTGDHAKVENKIVTVLNYRRSPVNVRMIVEQLYADRVYNLSELLEYAKKKKNCPYPAKFYVMKGGGAWSSRITCGHNPYLYARLVDDLRVTEDEGGKESLSWKERPVLAELPE